VLDAICLVANDTNHPDERIKYSVVDYGIVFSAKTPAELAEEAKLFTRTFKVDLAKLRAGLEGIRSTTFGSQIPTVTNILTLSPSEVAREYFADIGINWQKPPGKSVIYNEQSGTLVVTATAADLDIIETVLESVIGVAPQIHIKARFVDVTQESDKSPDFETYLGQLKNGSLLLETNPLDVFLGTTTNATVTGILTDSNFRVALHALQQRSGFEALGEPEATTTSGRRTIMKETSIINVITNFTYQETATNSGIIPQMENVELGSVLDSTATVLADGYTIDLNIKASYIEFLGYDKTTNTAAHYTKTGVKVDVPNISPRFEVRQASAHVNVWDGQTVVLGGMIIPSIQTTKEKVPFLGDLPVLGHLFQSQSKTEIKKNLMIFITATIVDPAANRIHTDDEMPFAEDGIPTQPNH
jgi:general secretion pathway protein D